MAATKKSLEDGSSRRSYNKNVELMKVKLPTQNLSPTLTLIEFTRLVYKQPPKNALHSMKHPFHSMRRR